MKAEDYTHRIGRTGRAGRDGMAVTFAEPRDRFRIRDIEDYTKQPFRADVIPGLEPTERPREKKNPFGKFGGKSGGFASKSMGRDRRDDRSRDAGFGGDRRGGNSSGGFDAAFAGKSHSVARSAGFGAERNEGRSNSFGGGSFAGKRFESNDRGSDQRGNGFAGNGFAADKAFGKSFKPRTPGMGDSRFAGQDGKSFAKPVRDAKAGPKPFAKTGFKPAGKTFAGKARKA